MMTAVTRVTALPAFPALAHAFVALAVIGEW
jgi:hypothetical protein